MKSELDLSFEKAFNEVNFSDIYNVMVLLNWKWCVSDDEFSFRIPRIDELQNNCRRLYELCEKKIGAGSSSGGFYVSIIESDFEENVPVVQIQFILEDCIGY